MRHVKKAILEDLKRALSECNAADESTWESDHWSDANDLDAKCADGLSQMPAMKCQLTSETIDMKSTAARQI
jgi:hypothetical protein